MEEQKKRLLCMIRHAKSSWKEPGQADYDRPLNDRGQRDAPMMGAKLKELGIKPDLIISSTAKRAQATARKIAGAIGYDKDAIRWVDKLYHCGPDTFEEVIYGLDASINTVFIVAHNPGITEFVNQLSPSFRIDNMPTCGIVGASFAVDEWSDFDTAEKEIILFEYPKKYI